MQPTATDVTRRRPPVRAAAPRAGAGPPAPAPRWAGRLGRLLVGAVVGACLVLRFVARSELWLDEVLSVNIARLPLPELFDALRHDGSPPLYYLLLHAWMEVAGTGTGAVRALSGLLSVAGLAVAWVAGMRAGGRRVAWALTVLLASSPFAVRYATETRMYALLVLLTLLAYLAFLRALTRPTVGRLAGLGVVCGLLLLTHYWAAYVVALFAVVALAHAVRPAGRRPGLRSALAIAAGALLFLPWIPSFLFQVRHTGTPWGRPAGAEAVRLTLGAWAGGDAPLAGPLAVVLAAGLVLGLARAVVRGDTPVRIPVVIGAGAFLAGIAAGRWLDVSFSFRYTSAVLPLLLLVAALGLTWVRPRPLGTALLGFAAAAGVWTSAANADVPRTQAAELAAVLERAARPGDVVVYCPDQLAPAVSRLLPGGRLQVTFPDGAPPGLVDWVRYEQRHRAADPAAFAAEVHRRAGTGRVWLVFSRRYRTAGRACVRMSQELAALRPASTIVVRPDDRATERAWLTRYDAA